MSTTAYTAANIGAAMLTSAYTGNTVSTNVTFRGDVWIEFTGTAISFRLWQQFATSLPTRPPCYYRVGSISGATATWDNTGTWTEIPNSADPTTENITVSGLVEGRHILMLRANIQNAGFLRSLSVTGAAPSITPAGVVIKPNASVVLPTTIQGEGAIGYNDTLEYTFNIDNTLDLLGHYALNFPTTFVAGTYMFVRFNGSGSVRQPVSVFISDENNNVRKIGNTYVAGVSEVACYRFLMPVGTWRVWVVTPGQIPLIYIPQALNAITKLPVAAIIGTSLTQAGTISESLGLTAVSAVNWSMLTCMSLGYHPVNQGVGSSALSVVNDVTTRSGYSRRTFTDNLTNVQILLLEHGHNDQVNLVNYVADGKLLLAYLHTFFPGLTTIIAPCINDSNSVSTATRALILAAALEIATYAQGLYGAAACKLLNFENIYRRIGTADGVHPDANGNYMAAGLVLPMFRQALRQEPTPIGTVADVVSGIENAGLGGDMILTGVSRKFADDLTMITPSDSAGVAIDPSLQDGMIVLGAAGNVRVLTPEGEKTYPLPKNGTLGVPILKIFATGTTATQIGIFKRSAD